MLEAAIGRADDPRVHALFFLIPDTREMAVLQHVQQLRLQVRVELANLVQEERAALRHFHAAGLRRMRPSERTLLKTE